VKEIGDKLNYYRVGLSLMLAVSACLPLAAGAQHTKIAAEKCGKATELVSATTRGLISTWDEKAAQEGYRQATLSQPSCPAAWFNLGVLAEANREWVVAGDALGKYLQLDPNGLHALRARKELELINTYLALPRAQVEAAIRRDDYNADIQRARMFLASKLYKEAISEAARAQLLDETRWESYAVVSLVMARENKLDDAQKFAQMAISRAPSDKKEKLSQILVQQTHAK
jgi:tetratricopeptide (TPR) repeat protein